MRILILGGTVFVGRALAEEALARGHEVTLFNRGRSDAELFPNVEKLQGNRDGDLKALEGRYWDAVIDPSGYVPRIVNQSVELLKKQTDHYTFISTISVYQEPLKPGADEQAPLSVLEDESIEDPRAEYYGPLKVNCERVVREAFPDSSLIVRPCIIVGPNDRWDRFAYWLNRAARGGEILAPGDPQRKIQFIDVRDLAAWIISMVEAKETGTFNAAGPQEPISMGEFLETVGRVAASGAAFTWVSDAFLEANQVTPMWEMPFWIPQSDPSAAGTFTVSASKALRAGLTFRPVEQIVRETLNWDAQRPEHKWRAGLKPEREQELLAAWHASQD